MINRRGALAAIVLAALNGVEWVTRRSHCLNRSSDAHHSFSAYGAELPSPLDDTLQADLARMASRVDSEEGVPMFLACQNLATSGMTLKPTPLAYPLNQKVASAFRRYAEEWQHLHPDATAGDVAKIVELLAARDFASGGTEAKL